MNPLTFHHGRNPRASLEYEGEGHVVFFNIQSIGLVVEKEGFRWGIALGEGSKHCVENEGVRVFYLVEDEEGMREMRRGESVKGKNFGDLRREPMET